MPVDPFINVTFGQPIAMLGVLGGFSIFTVEGYAKKYNEDADFMLARSRKRGEITASIMKDASVMSSDGKGMLRYVGACGLSPGMRLAVDGVGMIVGQREGEDFPLHRIVNDATKRQAEAFEALLAPGDNVIVHWTNSCYVLKGPGRVVKVNAKSMIVQLTAEVRNLPVGDPHCLTWPAGQRIKVPRWPECTAGNHIEPARGW